MPDSYPVQQADINVDCLTCGRIDLAGRQGFEPRYAGSEPAGLPLTDLPESITYITVAWFWVHLGSIRPLPTKEPRASPAHHASGSYRPCSATTSPAPRGPGPFAPHSFPR